MTETILEWYTPEDEPMGGAECLIFYGAELFKARYEGPWLICFTVNNRILCRPEQVDAWAYAPTAKEVFEDD